MYCRHRTLTSLWFWYEIIPFLQNILSSEENIWQTGIGINKARTKIIEVCAHVMSHRVSVILIAFTHRPKFFCLKETVQILLGSFGSLFHYSFFCNSKPLQISLYLTFKKHLYTNTPGCTFAPEKLSLKYLTIFKNDYPQNFKSFKNHLWLFFPMIICLFYILFIYWSRIKKQFVSGGLK